MSELSDALREDGFVPTGEESPVAEDGMLWKKSVEVVCDETATVIDGNHHTDSNSESGETYRYRNSERVKLVGGHVSSYDWGPDGDSFTY